MCAVWYLSLTYPIVHATLAVRARIESWRPAQNLKSEFADDFSALSRVDLMPASEICRLELIDAHKTIATRAYSCLRKFRAAWITLMEQHLDAGRIGESKSSFASPAFLVPKVPTQLPYFGG